MASVTTYGKGGDLRLVEFIATDGRRRKVRLGQVSKREAERVKLFIERIVADQRMSRPHDHDVAEWLSNLDAGLVEKLRAAGLAEGAGKTATTLGRFLDQALANLTCKPQTKVFYGHTARNLRECLGASRLMRDVGPAEADQWRAWLVEHEGLSKATVARRVIAARTLWRSAVRWRLVDHNPFEGVTGGSQTNSERTVYIPAGTVEAVLQEIPCVQWRAIVVLARWAGIRTPSETLKLTWADVDWQRGTLRVKSPKTEHHAGHAERLVPLFPRVRQALLDVFDDAEAGGEHVITRHRKNTCNLRTQLHRWIRSAGLTPWPRAFHNLRASRETELMREYDLTTVCQWIGNSPAVAARHYATSMDLDADFQRAAGFTPTAGPREAAQNAAQSAADKGGQGETTLTGEDPQPVDMAGSDASCRVLSLGGEGREWAVQDSHVVHETQATQGPTDRGGAECGALPAQGYTAAGNAFTQAVQSVANMPGLSDTERAELLRRMISEG